MSGSQQVAVPPTARRVGDAERDSAAALVAEAAGAGLFHLDELDDRLGRVLAARTADELAAVTAELPDGWLRERRQAATAATARLQARRSFAVHLRWYLLAMAAMVAIWLAVGVTSSAWYPWPVWPALGWGFGVFSHGRAAYGAAPGVGAPSSHGWGCHSGRGRAITGS